MSRLRPYQLELKQAIYAQWNAGAQNVLAVSPARSGKTVLFADIINENAGGSVAIAHRARLVEQMSFALAREGVRHRVIGPKSLQRACSARHLSKLHCNFVDPGARVGVASVNTLAKMSRDPWFDHVTLWVTDEGHHLLLDSMWGAACALFTRARGLSVTATPIRADGKGLGRNAAGVIDAIVLGRSPRELINAGYIVDYRLVLAESDVNIKDVHVGPSGEFVAKELSAAVRESKHLVGDIVKEYLLRAPGKRGITFAVDVASAQAIAAGFNAAGVRAEVMTADTPDELRLAVMREFEAGGIHQLVNVDLFGEGVDLPDVEVVSMARHTNSYGLFIQQFWRGGTLSITDAQHVTWASLTDDGRRAAIAASSKPKFIVIDHVNNVMRHAQSRGLPCMAQNWSLKVTSRNTRGSQRDDVVPLRVCLGLDSATGVLCAQPYERVLPACPYCGWSPAPAARALPEQVDGNMIELDPAALAQFRGEVVDLDAVHPVYNPHMPYLGQMAHHKRHQAAQEAQRYLRDVMALWCGYQMDHLGRPEAEMHKRFYFAFGVDTLSAQALGAADAEELRGRIAIALDKVGVVRHE